MEQEFSIAEAKNQLPELVRKAEKGKPIRLTRRGKPVAVLLSNRDYQSLQEKKGDLWAAIKRFRKRHNLKQLDFNDQVFANLRDKSIGRDFKWE